MEIGQICVKIAGRDAGLRCVILDFLDKNRVLIDGETRRRKCNLAHLEILPQKLKLEKNASREEVKKAFKELGVELKDKKAKAVAAHSGSARKQQQA